MSKDRVTLAELVEALSLFDEPMLHARYHALLARRAKENDDLARLPALAAKSARLAREGAIRWGRKEGAMSEDEFYVWAEYTVLDSFLTLAESQLRVLAHIARLSPTADTRAPFDQMVDIHREIVRALRDEIKKQPKQEATESKRVRIVQEAHAEGDLRGQLEAAIDTAEQKPGRVREIVLSANALRRLRDQGLFRDGDTRLRGHPVAVDLGWDGDVFVIETWDRAPLDEILSA
ncbi:MAG TPA: hypothetical protein VFH78_04505 [Candidatus Thermoplasmatota archaeon]|nr:hypothetical protein [Candidatus Thermoplasmatota archaeon]